MVRSSGRTLEGPGATRVAPATVTAAPVGRRGRAPRSRTGAIARATGTSFEGAAASAPEAAVPGHQRVALMERRTPRDGGPAPRLPPPLRRHGPPERRVPPEPVPPDLQRHPPD